jgi:hypothetical protein
MKRKILSAAIAAVVAGLFGSAVRADQIEINATFHTGSLNQGVLINDATYLPVGTYAAGVYNFTVASTAGVVDIPAGTPTSPLSVSQLATAGIANGTTFQGICVDFTHEINDNTPHSWSVVQLQGVPASPSGNSGDGNGVGISQIQALAIGDLWDAARVNTLTAATAARLQIAIWDVLYDSPVGSNTNSLFQSNGNIAGAMMDASAALTLATTTYNGNHNAEPDVYALVDAPVGGFTQDFAIVGPVQTNVSGTPLPRAALAGFPLLAGLAGFELLRKRRGGKLQVV